MSELSEKEWVAVSIGLIVVTIVIIIPSFNIPVVEMLLGATEQEFSGEVIGDGLVIQDISVGKGEGVESGDRISVHYTGSLLDGTVFDSSRDVDNPFSFTVGRGEVIRGWELGIIGMSEGGTRLLLIPPGFGYGATPRGPIPANSTLIFEIELISIEGNE